MLFIFISNFLYLHKEQQQQQILRNAIFFVTNFLPISTFAFNFKRSFREKLLLKTTLRLVYRSYVYRYRQAVVVKYQIKFAGKQRHGVGLGLLFRVNYKFLTR